MILPLFHDMTIVEAFLPGLIQFSPHLFEGARDEGSFIHTPIHAQTIEHRSQNCVGKVKGGFCLLKRASEMKERSRLFLKVHSPQITLR